MYVWNFKHILDEAKLNLDVCTSKVNPLRHIFNFQTI